MDLPVDIKAAKDGVGWKKGSEKSHGDIYRHGLKQTTTSKPEKWWSTYMIAVCVPSCSSFLFKLRPITPPSLGFACLLE